MTSSHFSPRFPLFCTLLGAAFLPVCAPAHAQSAPRFGIDAGVFFPSNSKTKKIFGSRFTSIGPGFGPTQVTKRRIYPDIDLMREKRGGNRATIIFAGAKLIAPLGRAQDLERNASFAPYGGLGLNLSYANIDAPSVGIDKTGVGIGASAILGASFGGRFFGEGRYRIGSSAADFNFSGARILVGARF